MVEKELVHARDKEVVVALLGYAHLMPRPRITVGALMATELIERLPGR